jgi:hypothetical protein
MGLGNQWFLKTEQTLTELGYLNHINKIKIMLYSEWKTSQIVCWNVEVTGDERGSDLYIYSTTVLYC